MATYDYGLTFFTFTNLIEITNCTYKGLMATCDYGLTFSHFYKLNKNYFLHL